MNTGKKKGSWAPYLLLLTVSFISTECSRSSSAETYSAVETTCAEDIAVYGHHAYVADGPAGVRVVDVSDPSHPETVTTVQTEYALRVKVWGTCLYLCDGPGGLKVFSLDDPSRPVKTYGCDTKWACGMAITRDFLYLADYYGGMLIFSMETPKVPFLESGETSRNLIDIAHCDGLLATSDINYGLMVYRIGSYAVPEPGRPLTDSPGNYRDIACGKGFAFVSRSDSQSCVYVYSISDPANPQLVTTIRPARFIEGMTKFGDVLLLACGEEGVIAYDVSSPASPRLLWNVPAAGYARRATIYANRLYVAEMNLISVYDIRGMGGRWR